MKHLQTLPQLLLACMLSSAALAADGMTSGKPCPPAKQQAAKKPTPASSGLARTSKTGMGVRISYVVERPAVGAPSQVRLTVRQATGGPPLTIEVSSDGALRLQNGLADGRALQTGPSADYALGIVPQSDGLHYIHVYLRSGDMAEALAIPVQVGNAKTLAKPVLPKIMPDGQRVISIPAQQ